MPETILVDELGNELVDETGQQLVYESPQFSEPVPIAPVLTFPAVPIGQAHWSLISRTQSLESELDGSLQVLAQLGDRWAAQLTVSDLMGQPARLFSAFVNRLRGSSGRFYMTPPGCGTPLGSAAGSGVVNGANQTGDMLVTSGWIPNQVELLAVGDYFQIGFELKQIVATASSNAGGLATLTFTPPLRRSPTNGTAIIVNNPSCIMLPADDSQGAHDISGPVIYAFTLSGVEALDI
ncbi:MAG: hypothetical protein H7Y05_14980 [Steroidobacteraceae bacterium]|nr:hypothetical protein [Deltaproteobacteria bacterium]